MVVNWAKVFIYSICTLQMGASVAYTLRHNYRMAACWCLWSIVNVILAQE